MIVCTYFDSSFKPWMVFGSRYLRDFCPEQTVRPSSFPVTRAVFWAWNSSSIQLLNYFGLEGLVESFQAFHPGWASWPSYAKAFLPSDRYVHLPIGLIWPQGIYLVHTYCAYTWIFLNSFLQRSSFLVWLARPSVEAVQAAVVLLAGIRRRR